MLYDVCRDNVLLKNGDYEVDEGATNVLSDPESHFSLWATNDTDVIDGDQATLKN
jgi:hypothetical protein